MKKLLTLYVFLIGSLSVYAQKENKDTLAGIRDTIKMKWGSSKIWILTEKKTLKRDSVRKQKHYKLKEFAHWAGFDVGICSLTTLDNKFKLPDDADTTHMNYFLNLNYGKSFYFSLNLLEKSFNLYQKYIILTTGLGMEWNGYNFRKNITLSRSASYISASNTTVAPDSIIYSKNKLKTTFIKIPLLLEFNTNNKNPNKSFHISGGIELGYKISSKTKQIYEINGLEYNVKRKGDYNLTDLKYSYILRVGYGNYFTAFFNYGVTPLFQYKKGPELFPITAGISFSL